MITRTGFPYKTRPPLGALPYCRFFQAVKACGTTERGSGDKPRPLWTTRPGGQPASLMGISRYR